MHRCFGKKEFLYENLHFLIFRVIENLGEPKKKKKKFLKDKRKRR